MLREDQCPLGEDVELALAPRDSLRVEALAAQLGRETRGPRVVAVSGGAVVDLDAHEPMLARGELAAEAVERIQERLPLRRIARERLAQAPLALSSEP